MIKSQVTENLLDVVTKYITWDFIDWIKYAEILLEQNLGYHMAKTKYQPTGDLIENNHGLGNFVISKESERNLARLRSRSSP